MQLLVLGAPDPSVAYFNTLSHIYPLMIGSLVGIIVGYPRTSAVRLLEQVNPRFALAIVVFCLALIAALALTLNFENPLTYQIGILLTSLAAAAVIALGRGMQWRLVKGSEVKPLNYLAEVSYSLYLFHWPVAIICTAWMRELAATLDESVATVATLAVTLFGLVLSFVLAHLSYKFVEKPFASGGHGATAWRFFAQRKAKIALSAGSFVLAVLCVVALGTAPRTSSLDEDLRSNTLAMSVDQLGSAQLALGAIGKEPKVSALGVVSLGSGTTAAKRSSITVIGDSVTVAPAKLIKAKTGAKVDAKIGRSMTSGIEVLKTMQSKGTLGTTVVIALAVNTHADSFDSAKKICELIEPGHHLIFVTSYGIGKGNMAKLSEKLRTLPSEYNYVSIADWADAISKHKNWLAQDGYHIDDDERGKELYAQVIADAVTLAQAGSVS
jgi:hypothetical protein